MAADRAERGPVEGELPASDDAPSPTSGQFMEKIGALPPGRQLRGTGTDG